MTASYDSYLCATVCYVTATYDSYLVLCATVCHVTATYVLLCVM